MKKKETTVTIGHTDAEGNRVESKPITMEEFKKLPETVTKAVRERMAQQDLDGNDVPVTKDHETKEYVIWQSERLFIRMGEEAATKVLAMSERDATKKLQRKVRVLPEEELMPGDFDAQSKALIEAVRKGC